MKTIDKIIESKEAPKDKNVLWVNGDKLLAMVKGKCTPVGGGSSASAKNQDKSVDITENGVTEVTADSGYTGLGKVTINANVQGGGGTEGGSELQYFDLSNIVAGKTTIVSTATLIKTNDYNEIVTLGLRCTDNSIFDIVNVVTAIAVDVNRKMIMEGAEMTVGDFLSLITSELETTLPSITEEQFYTL